MKVKTIDSISYVFTYSDHTVISLDRDGEIRVSLYGVGLSVEEYASALQRLMQRRREHGHYVPEGLPVGWHWRPRPKETAMGGYDAPAAQGPVNVDPARPTPPQQ